MESIYIKHDGPISYYPVTHKDGRVQKQKYIRKKYFSPEQRQEMKDLHAMGVKKKCICAKFKISLPTLNKYLL